MRKSPLINAKFVCCTTSSMSWGDHGYRPNRLFIARSRTSEANAAQALGSCFRHCSTRDLSDAEGYFSECFIMLPHGNWRRQNVWGPEWSGMRIWLSRGATGVLPPAELGCTTMREADGGRQTHHIARIQPGWRRVNRSPCCDAPRVSGGPGAGPPAARSA